MTSDTDFVELYCARASRTDSKQWRLWVAGSVALSCEKKKLEKKLVAPLMVFIHSVERPCMPSEICLLPKVTGPVYSSSSASCPLAKLKSDLTTLIHILILSTWWEVIALIQLELDWDETLYGMSVSLNTLTCNIQRTKIQSDIVFSKCHLTGLDGHRFTFLKSHQLH